MNPLFNEPLHDDSQYPPHPKPLDDSGLDQYLGWQSQYLFLTSIGYTNEEMKEDKVNEIRE